MMNGLSYCYHLGESTVIIRGISSDFEFLFHFSMKYSHMKIMLLFTNGLISLRRWEYSLYLGSVYDKQVPRTNGINIKRIKRI